LSPYIREKTRANRPLRADLCTVTKTLLICAGIIFIISVWLIIYAGKLDAFLMLQLASIIVFGYIAMVFDLETKLIPNGLIMTMLSVWVFTMTLQLFVDTEAAVRLLRDSVLGFAIGGGLFLLVYIISRKGLGGGDVKFMAAAGLYLGFWGTIPVILYGTVIAAITGGVLIFLKKINRKDAIPLAPFLFIGIVITVFTQ
jgi:prepilin signal peptidase PulO-like enzyme (type II secretory pathway)